MPIPCSRRTRGLFLSYELSTLEWVFEHLLLLGFGVLPLNACRSANPAVAERAKIPFASAKLVGAPEPVFDTRNSCELIDIPDAFPRAFRDYKNDVHLIATHFVARAMVGPNLDQVHHECRVIYRSLHDADPTHFSDEDWITSTYTEDGRRVAALMHSEYHGDQHPGECGDMDNPSRAQDCAWIAITYAESQDGGKNFNEARPPANLVADLPYPYDKDNRGGAIGYDSPTNILKLGKYYYSMINVRREYGAQRYSPCLMRTDDVFDAASWKGFDGNGFTIRFINPYLDRDANPEQHVCYPIFPGTLDSLAIDQQTGAILGIVYVEDNRYGRGSGLYMMASRDLIRWSAPSLVASTNDLLASDNYGNFSYLYFGLLDPKSTDRNFITVSATPYVYYVRLDDYHPPYQRVLLRRRIEIAVVE